jgi:antitoxin (DNA-binding transcriptional repressor) of toxin-antitoxin stability system
MTLSVEKFPELQALLAAGQEVTLEDHGQIVARVTPVAKTRGRPIAGLLSGKIRIADDFDHMPEDLIELFENSIIYPKD